MNPTKIIVSRTDRAGDFILTLPVFRELKRNFPNATIIAHLRAYTAPLAKFCKEIDSLIIDDDYKPGIFSLPLIKALKGEMATHAIVVHPTPRTIVSLYFANVPYRAGRASNLFMGLLNKRHIQHRSQNIMHEYEYNLDLIKGLTTNINYQPYTAHDFFQTPKKDKAVVIHPGSGGSAYNITTEQYVKLAQELTKNNIKVAISLGATEKHLKPLFESKLQNNYEFICDVPDLFELGRIFSGYKLFVGGSTGPLHLAALLGLHSVAFFPPVKAMTPTRWGPKGNTSHIIQPNLPPCTGKCSGCIHNPCMETLNLNEAISHIKKHC